MLCYVMYVCMYVYIYVCVWLIHTHLCRGHLTILPFDLEGYTTINNPFPMTLNTSLSFRYLYSWVQSWVVVYFPKGWLGCQVSTGAGRGKRPYWFWCLASDINFREMKKGGSWGPNTTGGDRSNNSWLTGPYYIIIVGG